MNYTTQDISVVIVTYNREKDLAIAINSFKKEIKYLGEVLIIDNSQNEKTEKYIKSLKNPKIIYLRSKINSLTISRNLGVAKSNKKTKIISFLDDDISLNKYYFKNILEIFNKNKTAIGVSGYYFPKDKKINKIENMLRKLFLIENWTINSAKVLSVYGASYPYLLTKTIRSSWLSGFNMNYKKEAFSKDLFENKFFRYALAEDFDFSVRVHKKYPTGLFITPYAQLVHRTSPIERMPTEKLAYMNHINHFYIQAKSFYSFIGIISWGIALFGSTLLKFINAIYSPKKSNLLKVIFHLKALIYCFRRLSLIRKGKLDLPNIKYSERPK